MFLKLFRNYFHLTIHYHIAHPVECVDCMLFVRCLGRYLLAIDDYIICLKGCTRHDRQI
jgi:hypothetical protein